jgi:hypothetical protein
MRLVNFLLSFICMHLSAVAFAATTQPYVVYGQDSRHEYDDIYDPGVRALADATVVLVEKSSLRHGQQGKVYGSAKTWQKEENLCPNERFADQPSFGYCSGSLIGPDLVLTAGHCILTQKSCEKTAFIFDFKMPAADNLAFDSDNVYGCKKIIYRSNANSADFAVVQIDRVAKDRAPVTLTSAPIKAQDSVFMIGYPMGIPLKLADDSHVRESRSHTFMTDLDAFGGNSGSAVFSSQTHELLGILVSGEDDTFYDEKAHCKRVLRCSTTGCRGETVMKISVLRERIGI